MSANEQTSEGRATAAAGATDGDGDGDTGHYTGVVLIHGLGPIRRNGMLEQALNSLSYWYNHEAGLVLRSEGRGRVWLDPHITDNPDPDQPESHARVELVAPNAADTTLGGDAAVRLEFREVWWAESFGLPDIGKTIAWARGQWSDQARHLLVPIGKRVGPGQTAAGTPAHEIAQAITYQPLVSGTAPEAPAASPGDVPDVQPSAASIHLGPLRRAALHTALWLYDRYQYLWKALQWLLLTPFITVLLLIMGIVRVLAVIPFLRPAVVTSFAAITNNVMLHWVAEVKVYLLDYTRSAAVRQRFEREVRAFLKDDRCDRVVVIAESGGTYIAYEGLTTLLAPLDQPEGAQSIQGDDGKPPKPVTFVSIATALRRIWLLSDADPHRVHGVLPRYVRWIHFWARYDPVAAGPLNKRSLPPIENWNDPDLPDPYHKILATLEHCENVDVANTDSTFTDHVNYWDNLEQVVGPIAAELVAGHPALEREVRKYLASRDAVLLRRWSVAWRYSVSFIGALAAGFGILIWAVQHPEFGQGLTSFLGTVNWGALVTSVCPACTAVPIHSLPPNPTIQQLEQYATQNAGAALVYLIGHYVTVPALLVGTVALVVAALCNLLIGRLVARPTPFSFAEEDAPGRAYVGALFGFSAIGVALVFIASVIFSNYVHRSVSFTSIPSSRFVATFILALGIAELFFLVPYLATLVVTIQRQQWGWLVGVILGVFVVATFDAYLRSALLIITVAGCLACLVGPSGRTRGWRRNAALALVAVMTVYASIGTTLFDFNLLRTPLLGAGVGVEYLLPMLIYALWSGPARPAAGKARLSAPRKTALVLAALYLVPLSLRALPLISQPHHYLFGSLSLDRLLTSDSTGAVTSGSIEVALLLLIGALMVVLAFADAWRTSRRGWLVGIPLLLAALLVGLEALLQVRLPSSFPEEGVAVSLVLVTTALIYALWADFPRLARRGLTQYRSGERVAQ